MLDRRGSGNDHFDGGFGMNGNFGAQSHFPQDSSSMSIRSRNGPDSMFRHVAPQATHGVKFEQGTNGFQENYQYPGGNPQADLRLPITTMGVDETLSRMKLQSHPQGGTDLQSFIRYAAKYISF